MYDEIIDLCKKVLNDEKNTQTRALLTDVMKDLTSLQEVIKEKTVSANDEVEKISVITEKRFNLEKLGILELSRLGFACQLTLLGSCGSRFSVKNLTTSLEFASVLLNSGLIPTNIFSKPPEIQLFKNGSSGASEFFSKILGREDTVNCGETFSQLEEAGCYNDESVNDAVNVFITIIRAVLAVSRCIQKKDVNERLLFTIVTALEASIVPRFGRRNLDEEPYNNYDDHFFAVGGKVLLFVVEELFGILGRNNLIFPLSERIRSALNHIAKSLSKAVENEIFEKIQVNSEEVLNGTGKYQLDVAKLLEYCCSLIRSPVLNSVSTRQLITLDNLGVLNKNPAVLFTALGLIFYLIVNGGLVFRNSTTIIDALRSAVIPCALSTALLKDIDIFRLSVNILLSCAITFGHLMLNEISTIFCHLFFRVLELKTFSLPQKSIILEAFYRYIEEPENLIALFLNYDCKSSSLSVYEQMIWYLAALSLPQEVKATCSNDSDKSTTKGFFLDFLVSEPLQRTALTTFLLVACSNRQWIERFDKNILISHKLPCAGLSTASRSVETVDKMLEDLEDTTLHVATTENDNDEIIQVLRIKEAFRKFLYYMNDQKDPDSAIEFLKNEPLLLPQKVMEHSKDFVGTVGDSSDILVVDDLTTKKFDIFSNEPENYESEKMLYEAEKIAVFFKEKEDYIDKLVLGEYFAKSFQKPQSRMIFVKWIEQHSFAGMTLDVALRMFLGGFKLNGEAQVVDKTMELFAAQYYKENLTSFRSANTVFILSFSICMLNTDAHSPHVKNKMTLDEFIRNNAGIDEGNDVDSALLRGIYERIVSNEIKLRSSKLFFGFLKSRCNEKGTLPAERTTSSGLLETIPILRHFAPVARAINDRVMIPSDVAGNTVFNTAQRKQERVYQSELHDALKDVIEALESTKTPNSGFVKATKIESAIPMWGITVEHLVECLVCAFEKIFNDAEVLILDFKDESYHDTSNIFFDIAENREYFDILLRGVVDTVSVCCSFGTLSNAEDLIERLFALTQLEGAVVIVSHTVPAFVKILKAISKPRIELLVTLLNLFLANGASLTTKCWCFAYKAVSLLDLIFNGIDDIWKRRHRESLQSDKEDSTPDTWFKDLDDIPCSFDNDSIHKRAAIITGLRSFSSVNVWLERLFDATEYPPQTQVFMSSALVSICESELECLRTFSLTNLFDFLTVCASFSSRMQWRYLWTNASKVFILAGKMSFDIANSALGGLRIVALSYLVREELLNYSFQKEVLVPYEAILMGNQDVRIRQKVIEAISEIIEIRGSHLASGWNVVFSILSHCAVIPEVVKSAWNVCQSIVTSHVYLMKDCFKDLIFCITSFACNNVEESIALLGVSYIRACGHWLQFGLECPPGDLQDATSVTEWASRFKDADNEARAAQLAVGLPRVTLSLYPISSRHPLKRPTNVTEKSSFSLWMSLLEGIVPIFLVHPSVRVRSHIICSLWSFIDQYAGAFATDVQDFFFNEILRPVMFSFFTHTFVEREAALSPMDYRLLAFLSLKSMFIACCKNNHLLFLACETFARICELPVSLERLRVGLIDVILRICVDIDPSGRMACRDWQGRTSELWVSRLLHQLVQLGYIDIINLKMTTGWCELHNAVAATTSALTIDVSVDKDILVTTCSYVTNTVLKSILDGIIAQLFLTMTCCNLPKDCLLCSRAIRHAYLVVALYCSTDLTESVFPMLLSGFSYSASKIPEQQLIIPYLLLLVEFVFFLRLNSLAPSEAETLKMTIYEMCLKIRQSRDFCVCHQTELIKGLENGVSGTDVPVSNKHKGRAFIDIFRSGKAPLTSLSGKITKAIPERVFHEWTYLLCVLGLKCVFALNGVTAQCITANALRDLLLLIPSELEEELIKPFFNSCLEELDVGIDLKDTSTMSYFLTLLGQKN